MRDPVGYRIRASHRPEVEAQAYLGDGVYAVMMRGGVWLTAENGIEATDAIFLEPEVFVALQGFMKRHAST